METSIKDIEIHHISLNEQDILNYTIQPAEIKNALGAVAAVLNEYRFTLQDKELFKLFRTNEGNWYEFSDEISSEHLSLISALKSAIEKEEIAHQIGKVA